MKSKTHKRIIWGIVIIAIIVAGFLLFTGAGRNNTSYKEETARTGSITTYYSFSGNVEVVNSQTALAGAPATVHEVYVRERMSWKKAST